ncbi:hypothetical protein HMPREF0977_00666 [Clostridium sp. 1_1_41A1FAA]|nr:hypothetical protein HMPREF0977_00666 [Clostridium sp. 1_1_41A1FAA]
MSNIALIGFGEVGKSFIKLLQIKKICYLKIQS